MADDVSVLGDDKLRLLDVLIEEELAAGAVVHVPTAATPTRPWLHGIAALLGITIVLAMSWLAVRPEPRNDAASPQDPAAPRIVPFDPSLLPRVVAVRVGNERINTPYGAEFVYPRNVHHHEYRNAEDLNTWRTAIAACKPQQAADHATMQARHYWVELDLGDGAVMAGTADSMGMVRFGGEGTGMNADVKKLLEAASRTLSALRRRSEGLASTIEELRKLPEDSTRVVAPLLTAAEVRTELARFPRLQRLEFTPFRFGSYPGSESERAVPTKDLAEGLVAIPTLSEVTLHVDYLGAAGLRALASLPALRTLNALGEIGRMPAPELGALARQLEALRLVGGEPTGDQLQAISRSTTLTEFWLQCGPDFGPAANCLLAMPRLQRLSLEPYGTLPADDALGAIARTKVSELRLVRINSAQSLTKLAGLPSLRTLQIVDLRVLPPQFAGVSPMPQVRHLVAHVAEQLVPLLVAACPNATLHAGGPTDRWVSPFAIVR